MSNYDSGKPEKAGGMASVTSTFKQLIQSKRVKANLKNLIKVNKAGGFDCPGCAWGDSNEGMVHFCENGAKAIAWESTERKVTADFFKQYTVTQLRKQSDYWLEYQGRLCEPMRYNSITDKYEALTWDLAFGLIAEHLNQLSSPNQVEFYTSGRASNEASYLYQLFGRLYGTNNFPDCSNMCHEASGIALNAAIGVAKGTVVLDDFYQADTIFVYGQNPGTNHPRMMNTLRKAAKQGCRIVSVNNLKELALEKFASPQQALELLTSKSVGISKLYLTPKLGTDFALIRALAKGILEYHKDSVDHSFIAEHTQGFENYLTLVNNTSWNTLLEQTGVPQADVLEAAALLASSKSLISTWAMGLTQHKHSVDTIRELTNLHLMLGQLGRKGAGLSPIRGHSNVQGNRTMGINEQPSAAFLNTLSEYFSAAMPMQSGHNVQSALKALHQGNSKVLICLGGNLAAAAPDTEFTHQAMSKAKLNVQISTKLNRSHLMLSKDALILPCLGRTELDEQATGPQQITVEDTFSMVHASAGATQPISKQCLSETDIVAQIAHATSIAGTPALRQLDWLLLRDDYSQIRKLIGNTIQGFADFNQRLQTPLGFHLSNPAANLQWNTNTGKANFNLSKLPKSIFSDPVSALVEQHKEMVFTLQSMRSHDQYNTTIYGMDDRYRGVKNNRNVLFINPKDAKKLAMNNNDLVEIESIWDDGVSRKVDGFTLYFYDVPRGNVAAYYPEVNPLVAIDSVGDLSYTPTSKSIPVVVRKSARNK